MFGNRKRRRKEKRKMHFSFFCLICNKKGNQKKIYVFSLLCPYKCEKCIKVMGKYVNLCYIMLFMWAHFFLEPLYPFKSAQIGWIANLWAQGKWFLPFFFFHGNQTEEKTTFPIISLFFLSSPPIRKGEVGVSRGL